MTFLKKQKIMRVFEVIELNKYKNFNIKFLNQKVLLYLVFDSFDMNYIKTFKNSLSFTNIQFFFFVKNTIEALKTKKYIIKKVSSYFNFYSSIIVFDSFSSLMSSK